MKYLWKRIILLLLCLLLISEPVVLQAKEKNTVIVNVKGTELYDYSFRALDLLNKERKKKGLKKLVMDAVLLEVAMQRAHECVLQFAHERPNGLSCHTAHQLEFGEAYGENIAFGQKTPEWVTDAWMHSSGHKANMLDSEWEAVGIACVKVNGSLYWVQFFGNIVRDKVTKSDYKNKNKTRPVEVKKNKQYYKASFRVDTTSLKVGQSTAIHTLWNGKELANSGVTGDSSNPSVCRVSNGKIVATGEGTAKVRIYFAGYESKALTKKITVKGGKVVKAKKITLNKKKLTLKVGGKTQLKATLTPKNTTQKSLQWSTSNKKIVKVSQKGTIKAVKKGKATVTVKVKGTSKTAKCKVTVK